MKKNYYFVLAASIMLFSSCESKFSRLANDVVNDTEDYIDAFNNAKSREEVRAIERDMKSKEKYYEAEFEKIDNETNIKEKQRVMQQYDGLDLGDRLKQAKRDAYNRFD